MVVSLGGSRIVPGQVDVKFLREFKGLVDSHRGWRFVVVTGGGSTARTYISALRKLGRGASVQSREGIAITRYHAEFMTKYFGKEANDYVPLNMRQVKNLLLKNRVVFCGALRSNPRKKSTTDATAAKLANYLGCSFINLTNVRGLYDKDPSRFSDAKFISRISWKDFDLVARKIKFENGQHFVLDQAASKVILKNRVRTFIVGSLKSVDNILKNKKFVGTVIEG